MYPAHHRWFVEKHCQNPELVDDVGIPNLIHKHDLVAPAPLWLKKTEEIRNDPVTRKHVGWIAEMSAYALAAAELGLRRTTYELVCVNKEDLADRPVVHYCFASGGWMEKPGDPVALRLAPQILGRKPEQRICPYRRETETEPLQEAR